MPLVDDLAPVAGEGPDGGPVAAADTSLSPPPPPPMPRGSFGPYTGPAQATAPEAGDDEPAEEPASAVPAPGFRLGGTVIGGRDPGEALAERRAPRDPNRVVWRWHHVLALALAAWGIPFAVSWWLGIDRSIAALLNRALAVQIVGYLVGGLAVAALVWTRQKGDWATLGLGDDARRGRIDLVRGFGFGVALFLGYLPVGLFTNGKTSLDPMIALLLGNADGAGLVLTCAVVIVGAPVVEEVFFRGVLYEKLARRFPQVAILVTSILFMLIHGAVIFQIFILGLLFALKRSKGESVWFTIGAHSAWNASVIVAGIVMLTASALSFTSPSGAYELRYPRDWEREPAMEVSLPQGRFDLALASANGSVMGVIDVAEVPAASRLGSSRLLDQMPSSMSGAGGSLTNIDAQPTTFPGATEAYDVSATISAGGMTMGYQMVVVRPYGSDGAIVFMLVCPQMSCDSSEGDFKEMLDTVTLL
jgi:membrane protease YdiL (CAAX protease family)